MSDLETTFKKAVFLVRALPQNPETSTETRLSYYKFFKQATVGDVQGKQPWAVQFENRAKWDAWKSVEGMATEEAMEKYIA